MCLESNVAAAAGVRRAPRRNHCTDALVVARTRARRRPPLSANGAAKVASSL
jgi:hypothetical protein